MLLHSALGATWLHWTTTATMGTHLQRPYRRNRLATTTMLIAMTSKKLLRFAFGLCTDSYDHSKNLGPAIRVVSICQLGDQKSSMAVLHAFLLAHLLESGLDVCLYLELFCTVVAKVLNQRGARRWYSAHWRKKPCCMHEIVPRSEIYRSLTVQGICLSPI